MNAGIWAPITFDLGLLFGLAAFALVLWLTAWRLGAGIRGPEAAVERTRAQRLFWLAALVKTTIIVAWYLAVGGYEINQSVGDSGGYDFHGWTLALSFRDGNFYLFSLPPWIQGHPPGYHYWIASIYALFGRHQILISLFNAVLSLWIAVMIHRIALALFDVRTARIALSCTLFYPHWLSASYFLLKDQATAFAATLALWTLYLGHRPEVRALIFAPAVAVLAAFRPPLAMTMGLVGITHLGLAGRLSPRRVMAFVLAASALFAVVSSVQYGDKDLTETGYTTGAAPGVFAGKRFTFTLDSVGSFGGAVLGAPVTFASYAADSTIRFFYAPFFLFARGGPSLTPYHPAETPFRALCEALGGIYTGLLMPLIVLGGYHCVRRRPLETFGATAWLFSGVLAIIFAGALVRWRLPFIAVAFLLAAVGWSQAHKIREIYGAYIAVYAALAGANATLDQDRIIFKGVILAVGCMATIPLLKATVRRFRPIVTRHST